MLDIFITEPTAVLAHRQPDVMTPRGFVIASATTTASFSPEGLDWVPTFDAYRHREDLCVRSSCVFSDVGLNAGNGVFTLKRNESE